MSSRCEDDGALEENLQLQISRGSSECLSAAGRAPERVPGALESVCGLCKAGAELKAVLETARRRWEFWKYRVGCLVKIPCLTTKVYLLRE